MQISQSATHEVPLTPPPLRTRQQYRVFVSPIGAKPTLCRLGPQLLTTRLGPACLCYNSSCSASSADHDGPRPIFCNSTIVVVLLLSQMCYGWDLRMKEKGGNRLISKKNAFRCLNQVKHPVVTRMNGLTRCPSSLCTIKRNHSQGNEPG